MTRFGKCETCRTRKVKCDEALPACGACSKTGRKCHYNKSADPIFVQCTVKSNAAGSPVQPATAAPYECVGDADENNETLQPMTLRLKRTRRAQNGGVFKIFGQSRPAKTRRRSSQIADASSIHKINIEPDGPQLQLLDPMPRFLCQQSKRSMEWGVVFGFEALDMNPLGRWVKLSWPSIEEDLCVELASDYALKSMLAFQQRDELSLNRAYSAGGKALRSLQDAIGACSTQTQSATTNLVAAVMLHYAAEHFIGLGSYRYTLHVLRVAEVLRNCPTSRPDDEQLIRNVVSMICVDDFIESTYCAKPSSLEQLATIPPLNRPCDINVALLVVDHLIVQLPRLITYVRAAAGPCSGSQDKLEAIRLVHSLYDSEADSYVGNTLTKHVKKMICSNYDTRSPTGTALDFDSQSTFILAVRYHTYRTLICGLLQTLANVRPHGFGLEIDVIEQQDVASAMAVATCLDYALKAGPSRPITALAMIIPIQFTFLTWDRLRKRRHPGSPGHQQALILLDWSMEILSSLHAMWKVPPWYRKNLQYVLPIFAGALSWIT